MSRFKFFYRTIRNIEEFQQLFNDYKIHKVIIDGTSYQFTNYDPETKMINIMRGGSINEFYVPTMLNVYSVAFCVYPFNEEMEARDPTEYLEESSRDMFINLFRKQTGTSKEYADAVFYSLDNKTMDRNEVQIQVDKKVIEFNKKLRQTSIY